MPSTLLTNKMATCHKMAEIFRAFIFFRRTRNFLCSIVLCFLCLAYQLSPALWMGIFSCNDHLIEVNERNFLGFFSGARYLCLMLDSLVKYERDKRNFVRYNCNGCGLFIVERTRYILMVTTILRAGRGCSVVLKTTLFFLLFTICILNGETQFH